MQEFREDKGGFISLEDKITSSLSMKIGAGFCRSLGRKLIAGGSEVQKKSLKTIKDF
jgi:hypothetical protein